MPTKVSHIYTPAKIEILLFGWELQCTAHKAHFFSFLLLLTCNCCYFCLFFIWFVERLWILWLRSFGYCCMRVCMCVCALSPVVRTINILVNKMCPIFITNENIQTYTHWETWSPKIELNWDYSIWAGKNCYIYILHLSP